MCGIAGLACWTGTTANAEAVVRKMADTLVCRGPDDSGVWADEFVALGHRRLAVIDLAGGAQPMGREAPDGPVAITYGGETYNFAELREELRGRGHRFSTRSDTEVVLAAYLEWGADFAARLEGMFAVAIWDGRTRRLLLARDRLGVKPLYYQRVGATAVFGSEPKALLASGVTRPVVGPDGLRELFAPVKHRGAGVWSGVREVEPGTCVMVDSSGVRVHTYWRLEAVPHHDSLPETIEKVRALLDRAVARELVSDVPTCLLLSGGLDSSAITALAAARQPVRTYSIDHGAFAPDALRSTDDLPYAREVAAHLAADHREVAVSAAQLADPELRTQAIAARDAPTGLGEADHSLYLLLRAVRGDATVVLSGEGADELFGGYPWCRDRFALTANTFPWIAYDHRAASTSDGPRVDVVRADVLELLDLRGYVADSYAAQLARVPRLDGEGALDRRMRRITHLQLTTLLRSLLDRKDRISSALGLELRVPFCDRELVEYVFNVPWTLVPFGSPEKLVLRQAVRSLLPRPVLDRRKSPYPVTQDGRYHALLVDQVAALVATARHRVFELFDRAAVAGLLRRGMLSRASCERILDFATWLDLRQPEFV